MWASFDHFRPCHEQKGRQGGRGTYAVTALLHPRIVAETREHFPDYRVSTQTKAFSWEALADTQHDFHKVNLTDWSRVLARIPSTWARSGIGDHDLHLHNRAPDSLCAAICSFVCRVSTSFRDGLIGCAQSQSLLNRGSVAHPAVETAIKSSIAIGLYVMSNLRGCCEGLCSCCLPSRLPGGLACSSPLEPGNPNGCKQGACDGQPTPEG
jgi:hypothetical protein